MSEENQSEYQLKQNLLKMKGELDQINEKYIKAKNELRENERVKETLQTLPDERVAYRIIGEVVAKQTVKEVRPYISAVVEQLTSIVS